jgi:hypothetical protein
VVNSNRSARQAAAARGNLAVRLLRDRDNAFWTMTAWVDEAAMKSFMTAGAHGSVMRKLLDWCDEAFLVHWTQEDAVLPSWEEGHKRLQNEGWRSKLHHPSANHEAFIIPPPVTGPAREGRTK